MRNIFLLFICLFIFNGVNAQYRSIEISMFYFSGSMDKSVPPIFILDDSSNYKKEIDGGTIVLEENKYNHLISFILKNTSHLKRSKCKTNEIMFEVSLRFKSSKKRFNFILYKDQFNVFLNNLYLFTKDKIKNNTLESKIKYYQGFGW